MFRYPKLACVKNKQRYLCRECGKTTRVGDKREKYGIEQKIKVAKLFTEGVSIRSIERIENIPASLIFYWVSKAEPSLIESKNSLIRHYLARFNRRTKRYSKVFDMIFNSLLILFNKSLLFISILI